MIRYLLIRIVRLVFGVANYGIWAYCILSWFANSNPNLYKAYRFLGQYIEPVLAPIRKLIRPLTYKIGIDFSPILLAIIISYVYRIVLGLLYVRYL